MAIYQARDTVPRSERDPNHMSAGTWIPVDRIRSLVRTAVVYRHLGDAHDDCRHFIVDKDGATERAINDTLFTAYAASTTHGSHIRALLGVSPAAGVGDQAQLSGASSGILEMDLERS